MTAFVGTQTSSCELYVPHGDPVGAQETWACAEGAAIVRMNGVAHATVPACFRNSRRLSARFSATALLPSFPTTPRIVLAGRSARQGGSTGFGVAGSGQEGPPLL